MGGCVLGGGECVWVGGRLWLVFWESGECGVGGVCVLESG